MSGSSSSDEELEKKVREKFFEEAEFKPRELYELVDKLSDFATINKAGDVFIKQECTTKEKSGLVLCARFLGNKLDEEINPVVSIDDVAKYGTLDRAVATARLSELVKEGFAIRVGEGSYKARSLPTVKKFIEQLITKYLKT